MLRKNHLWCFLTKMQRPIASNAFYKIEIRFMPDSRNKNMGTERNILISFSKSKVNPRNRIRLVRLIIWGRQPLLLTLFDITMSARWGIVTASTPVNHHQVLNGLSSIICIKSPTHHQLQGQDNHKFYTPHHNAIWN